MDIYSQILAVALVLALLGAALWALRRVAGIRPRWPGTAGRQESMLELHDRLSLSPQHALHLVRVGDRAVLVAVHSAGCVLLESRPWREVAGIRQVPEDLDAAA